MLRVQALLKATPERWVVLSDDEGAIVVESASFQDAAALAEEKGLIDPVMLFVPSDWMPRIL